MKIAVVDDSPRDLQLIKGYVERYFKENGGDYQVRTFENGLEFLDEEKLSFDIVFMDVEMPHLNGIETARNFRKRDKMAVLVFITNMAQYAIHGYEVDAIEYMVKPVEYYNFFDKMEKALRFVKRDQEKTLLLHGQEVTARIPVSGIYYMEKERNYILFHTKEGDFRERGSMGEMEEKLAGSGFSRCITGCLVNLRYISKMSKDAVWVGDRCLPISRSQRKQFAKDFADFLGGEQV